MRHVRSSLIGGACILLSCIALRADLMNLDASIDTTIYSDVQNNSNAQGTFIFAGVKGVNGGFGITRALMSFDIAGNIPSGAAITSAVLTLFLDRAPPTGATDPFFLHTLESPWDEGTSDAGGSEAGGAPGTPGDATWLHNGFSTSFWQSAGGDYDAVASATGQIGTVLNFYAIQSDQLAVDVQTWLDDPGTNFGWIFLGDESSTQNARRFASNADDDFGPILTVGYVVPEPSVLLLILCGSVVLLRRSFPES